MAYKKGILVYTDEAPHAPPFIQLKKNDGFKWEKQGDDQNMAMCWQVQREFKAILKYHRTWD